MTATPRTTRARRWAALALYAASILCCLFLIWSAHDEIASEAVSVASAQDRLDALRHRQNPANAADDNYGLQPGAQFLGGDRLTVAAAELQRRIASEVTKAGGAVVSSRVERSANPEAGRDLRLAVEFEIAQGDLQALLYRLESSTPFVFVEKLALRSRTDAPETAAQPRLRVALLVSGTWRDKSS